MVITCPACGARHSIEAALTDDHARKAVLAALKLPAPLGDLLMQYLAMFRPRKQALSWSRAGKLLTELSDIIISGQVSRDGVDYSAPLAVWQSALEEMLKRRDKIDRPLKSHGYLLEIVAASARREQSRTETKREKQDQFRPKNYGAKPLARTPAEPGNDEVLAKHAAMLGRTMDEHLAILNGTDDQSEEKDYE